MGEGVLAKIPWDVVLYHFLLTHQVQFFLERARGHMLAKTCQNLLEASQVKNRYGSRTPSLSAALAICTTNWMRNFSHLDAPLKGRDHYLA